jgi:hypothetical protein
VSLKAFHIVFIVCSLLISLGFAVWSFSRFMSQGNVGTLVMGALSALVLLLLGGYGGWFLRKLQREAALR